MRRHFGHSLPSRTLALAALLLVAVSACSDRAVGPPNVVLIVSDDQAFSTLPYMPHVESLLAREGVTFANFILNDPVCCPSRVTILLGQNQHNHHLEVGFPGGCAFRFYEDQEHERAIGPVIQAAGYRTGVLGKYLNSYDKYLERHRSEGRGVPRLPGWDDYHILADRTGYYDFRMHVGSEIVRYDQRPFRHQTDVLAQLARDFIEASVAEETPFFLYIVPQAPHSPAEAARRHVGSFEGLRAPRGAAFNQQDVSTQPSLRKSPPLDGRAVRSLDRTFRKHVATLQSLDELVRDVVKTLRGAGVLDDTYIFFTSDNGYHFGEHRIAKGKSTPFEESIRFPLIVRGPGVPAGVSRPELVSNVDLHPTILDIIGLTPHEGVDGRSLLPLLGSRAAEAPWRQSLVIESVGRRRNQGIPAFEGIRTARYKLVSYSNGERELYDLEADPAETRSVLAETGEALVSELETRLAELIGCKGAECRRIEDQPFESSSPGR